MIGDLTADTYEVYLDDAYLGSVSSRQPKSKVSHISFAQWNDGAGAFLVDGEWAPVASAGTVPNASLMLNKAGTPDITLTWDPSCQATDTDYAIYEGVVGSFQSHVPIPAPSCTTAGTAGGTLQPGSGSHYYLVVPQGSAREGSYGTDSNGMPRPSSISACRPQLVGACPEIQ